MVEAYHQAHSFDTMDLDSLSSTIRNTWNARFGNVPEKQRPAKGTFYLPKGNKPAQPKKQAVQVVQKTSAVKEKGPAPSHSGQQQAGTSQNKGKAPESSPSSDDKKKKKNRRPPRKNNARNAIEGVTDDDDHEPRFELVKPTIVHPHSLRNRIEAPASNFTMGDYLPRDIPPHVPYAPIANHSVASFSGSGLTIRTAKVQKPWKAPGNAPYPVFHKAKSLAERIGITPTIQTVKNLEGVVKGALGEKAYIGDREVPAILETESDCDRYECDDSDELTLFPGCTGLPVPDRTRDYSRASTPEPAPYIPYTDDMIVDTVH